jgi:type IV fimbrial biogenesis protein FimT
MKNRSRGFTLMELMIVLTLAGIILALGAPSFGEFRRSNRMAGIANDFLVGVQVARSEAIKRQVSVSMCPSSNPEADDAAACNGDMNFGGWIVFTDPNGDCERDEGEMLLQARDRIDTGTGPITPKSISDGNCISFAPTGFTRPDPGGLESAQHTLFCDDRGTTAQPGTNLSSARAIDVTPTGRARVTRDITEIDALWPACGGA